MSGSSVYFDINKDSNGNAEVAVQDQFTEIIDLYLTQLVDDITIDVNTSVDDVTVRISTTGEVPVVGQFVCFKEERAFYQGEILQVLPVSGNTYDVVLDSPLDFAFTTAGGCSLNTADMNVNGSIDRQIFDVSPEALDAGISWDITRMQVTIRGIGSMDDGKFGDITGGLTNGVVFRQKMNGTRKNIFNAKNNGDFRLRAYDVNYIDATLGPSGEESVGIRRTFSGPDKNGVTIRLRNDDDPDSFQIIVGDNLEPLTFFRVVVQGHVVE